MVALIRFQNNQRIFRFDESLACQRQSRPSLKCPQWEQYLFNLSRHFPSSLGTACAAARHLAEPSWASHLFSRSGSTVTGFGLSGLMPNFSIACATFCWYLPVFREGLKGGNSDVITIYFKKRRNCSRVSERPNHNVPSNLPVPAQTLRIWSAKIFIIGSRRPALPDPETCLDVRHLIILCGAYSSAASNASRPYSLKLVTLKTAPIPNSFPVFPGRDNSGIVPSRVIARRPVSPAKSLWRNKYMPSMLMLRPFRHLW